MKKLYAVIISALFITSLSMAQTVLFSDNFTTYDSTSGANYNGWQLSYYGFGSYYTSTQSSGPSGPDSYKFGRDSATAITPMFANTADSVHFWMKGNTATGGTMAQSTFYIYQSPDGQVWNPLTTFSPPISTTGGMQHLPLAAGTVQLKFFYDKDTGNVAFDDFSVTASVVGVQSISPEQHINIYPSPTSGKLSVNFSTVTDQAKFTLLNVIGKEVGKFSMDHPADSYTLNVASLEDGIYFLRVQYDNTTFTKRIVVKH
jgi:hypothetical protein